MCCSEYTFPSSECKCFIIHSHKPSTSADKDYDPNASFMQYIEDDTADNTTFEESFNKDQTR